MLAANLLTRPAPAVLRRIDDVLQAVDAVFPIPGKHKNDLPYAIRDLSQLLTQERGSLSRSYWAAPRFLSAYLYFFLPWNIYRLAWLLPALPLQLPTEDARIVDLGSGPLTLPLALWCARPDLHGLSLRFICADIALKPMQIGLQLLEAVAGASCPWETTLQKAGLEECLHGLTAPVDWIMAGNVLNELPPQRRMTFEDRLGFIAARMQRKLKPAGQILLVEPGSRLGGKVIATTRKCAVQNGMLPEAPCPHADPCPALEQNLHYAGSPPYSGWCHFIYPAVDIPPQLAMRSRQAGMEKNTLAVSCLLLRNTESVSASLPSRTSPANEDSLEYLEALYNSIMQEEENTFPPTVPAPEQQKSGPGRATGQPDVIRIISDIIRLPDQEQPARYGCSRRGLVLLLDALKVPSGGASRLPPGTLDAAAEGEIPEHHAGLAPSGRDPKSGALIVQRKAQAEQPSPKPTDKRKNKTTGTPKKVVANHNSRQAGTKKASGSTKKKKI